MERPDLILAYPTLFHMAEADTWATIRRHGLRSTTALLDLFEYDGLERDQIESRRRSASVDITHAKLGTTRIRDQKPLQIPRLEKILVGMTTEEWCRTLNNRVFFWTTEKRLLRLLGGAMYRSMEHDVLIVDTAKLVAQHGDEITLAPYNTGATVQTAPARGIGTFLKIEEYDFDYWRTKRSRKDAVVELAVDYAVLDIEDFVIRVERRREGNIVEILWER